MINKRIKSKIAIITGAIICSTVLTSCGTNSNKNDYPDSTITSSEAATDNQSQGTTKGDDGSSDSTNSTSYNSFLYNTSTSLSDTIGINDFGFSMSKHNNNADRRLYEGPYQNTSITLSEEHLDDFVNTINAENITYEYSDLFDIDNAEEKIEAYREQLDNQTDLYTDLICNTNEIPSESLLVSKITSNNSDYLATHQNYDQLSSDYTTLVADVLIDVLNAYHDDLDDETLQKVYCMLNDVKVVGIDSSDYTKNDLKTVYNAAVMDDGAVVLDINQINTLTQDNSLEKTIYHEAIHLFQRQAPDARIDGLTQIGSSQYVDAFDDTGEVNSLHYLWLYEASAEFMSMQLNDSKIPVTYKNMVGYLNTLNLITLIRPDYEEDSIATSQLSNNPDKIYDVLGADTPEEIEEIRNMLYSICCISDDREDFASVYEIQYGTGSLIDNSTAVKDEMRTGIAKTMTKFFYRNLAERVANTDVTMEDAFYLINVFEGALSRHLWYDDDSLYSTFEDDIRYYVDTQNLFFEYIAQDSGYTYDEVVDSFDNFAMVYYDNNTYHRNYSFTWLDEAEINYIGDVFTTNLTDFTVNIRQIVKQHGMD